MLRYVLATRPEYFQYHTQWRSKFQYYRGSLEFELLSA
jgi:hypothetical protein